MTTVTRSNPDKSLLPVCQLLPAHAREMLTTAANTQNPTERVNAINTATDEIRKTWPKYFQREA